ncbi:unnamed protein product, partial [Nesidiocoris tenuis]
MNCLRGTNDGKLVPGLASDCQKGENNPNTAEKKMDEEGNFTVRQSKDGSSIV